MVHMHERALATLMERMRNTTHRDHAQTAPRWIRHQETSTAALRKAQRQPAAEDVEDAKLNLAMHSRRCSVSSYAYAHADATRTPPHIVTLVWSSSQKLWEDDLKELKACVHEMRAPRKKEYH
jgi:hypothetical protein